MKTSQNWFNGENGPLLKAASLGLPVILDRINEAKSQVIARLNPVLEINAQSHPQSFEVPENTESPK